MLAGIYTILLSLRYLLLSYFRIYTWAKTLSFFTLFEAIATSLLVGIAVYLGYGLLGAVYVQLAVLGIIVIASSVIIMRNFGLAYPNFQGIKKYFAYGVPLIPTTWFVWVLNSSDRLVISYYCDLKDLGVYSLVYNLGYFLIGFIFNPIFLYFSPMVAKLWNEGQKERVKEMIEYTIKYGLMFTIPALFGFYVLGKPLILLLSTEEFVRGISLIPFVALGYILFMLSSFYEISIGLVEKTKVIPFVFGLCAALNIGLNILMVPRIGILGAAIATTISFAAQIGAFSLYSRCFFKFELCWGFILKSILISTLMALSIYSLIPHSSLLEIFISVIIGGTLYFGGLFVMRGFSQREIDFFYNLLLKTLKIKREQV
jgi:O-antigen/teichoic acid export membrane protein